MCKPSVKMGAELILNRLGQIAKKQSGPVKFLQKTLKILCRQFWRVCSPEQTALISCGNWDRRNSVPPGTGCRNAVWTGKVLADNVAKFCADKVWRFCSPEQTA